MTASEYKTDDTSLGVLTPEGIEFTLFPAGLPIRTCAYGIDKLIQWAFLLGVSIVTGLMGQSGGRWVLLILIFLIDWFYHVICELLFRGQSPGKRIMGIRVVRNDGSPVDPGSSLLRNLLRFADTFMFLCPIALVTMSASRGFRRLGDWAAGTLVIYASAAKTAQALRPLGRPLETTFGAAPGTVSPLPVEGFSRTDLSRLSHEERQAVLMFARRYPLLGTARADEIARPYVRYLQAAEGQTAEAQLPEALGDAASDSAYLLAIAQRLAGEQGIV
jgi:uncharacterized RDD family membrane protein YckC